MKLLPINKSMILPLSLLGALVLGGCAVAPQSQGATAGNSLNPAAAPGEAAVTVEGYPRAHVHGIAAIGDNKVLLATHEGLYDVSVSPARRIGPLVDWMGFSLGANEFYASGHPGPGTDLENPLGLMRSTDGGETWDTLSRSGISDFHALTVSRNAIIGFDGALRSTADGKNWQDRDPRIRPATLAADPSGTTVLATTEQGIWRSTDDGQSFSEPNPGAPVLQYVALAGQTAVGFTPDNVAWTSTDGGVNWSEGARAAGMVDAVALGRGGKDIWVSSSAGVEYSTNAAKGFTVHFTSGR
ncbi:exo-alpha-sialidase [Paeniglutamicibacter sp. ABSL32-1]|uniref:F510_1955 family glycosylhydrolase n=1 Tax=Paeniglutamicibacter quisquiliarum TaxID=2849498 RepID=UPI001C2D619A|nr:exo-alpha-sialidase [Paeniglutamicibacter quisquiliarum]MBV1778847.1 exo-alpha-sialidase [Paeniglutamicibacter quisquiliarum]